MFSRSKIIFLIIVFLLSFCSISIAATSEPINLGAIVSMIGGDAELGHEEKQAFEVAVEVINSSGGISGHPVNLIIVDGQSNAATYSVKAHRLLGEEEVLLGIGGEDISYATSAGQVFQEANVAFLDLAGTTPTIAQVGDCVFMTPIPDNDAARAIAKYVVDTLGYNTVTIFKDVGSSYGTVLTEYITYYMKEFSNNENPVPFIPSYNLGDQDFSSQITRLIPEIKKHKIQAIILPTWPQEAPLIAKQCREFGITLPLIGTDGTDTDTTTEVGGKSVEGMLIGTHFDIGMPDLPANVKSFAKAYQDKYGVAPSAFATLAYDALTIGSEAIELVINEKGSQWWETASLTDKRTQIKEALYRVDTKQTSQPVKFDENGYPKRGLVWKVVKDGTRVYADFIAYDAFTPPGINTDPSK